MIGTLVILVCLAKTVNVLLCVCVCVCFRPQLGDCKNDVWEAQTLSGLMDVLQESRLTAPELCPSPPNTSLNGTKPVQLERHANTAALTVYRISIAASPLIVLSFSVVTRHISSP